MRSYLSRPPDRCKPPSAGPAGNPARAAAAPGRFLPTAPAEKARRVERLRAALAGSAPDFVARLRHTGEGQP
jgi:hypothetical protein